MAKTPGRDSGRIIDTNVHDLHTVAATTWYGSKLRAKSVDGTATYAVVFFYDSDDSRSVEVAQFYFETDEWEELDLSGDIMLTGDKLQMQVETSSIVYWWASWAEE